MRYTSRSKLFRSLLVALAVCGAAVGNLAFDATPAAAAPFHRPDARIKIDCAGVVEWRMCPNTWTGDRIYNATATDQKVIWHDYMDYASEPDPRAMFFRISIRNDGSIADRFRVAADGVTIGYAVKFLRGTTNITPQVAAGTYLTPTLAPGATFLIRAKVSMPCDQDEVTYCGQDRVNRLVRVRSEGDPSVVDAVKFVRRIWVCTC